VPPVPSPGRQAHDRRPRLRRRQRRFIRAGCRSLASAPLSGERPPGAWNWGLRSEIIQATLPQLDELDREGLARPVSDCLAELNRQGIKQEDAARQAGCGVSTLRNMQNGTGTTHYGHELLTRVAEGLGLAKDGLVEGLQERLKGVAGDINEVRSRLEILVDINHLPPAG
jgi:hypothetical protein